MNFSRLAFVLCAAMALFAFTTSARADCGNYSIRGSYAFTIHGQIMLPDRPVVLIDGVARTTFDGYGHLKQVDAVAMNGNIALVWRPGSGSYTVNKDCTGTMVLENQGSPTLYLAIVVSQVSNTIHTVVTNPGFAITSDAERVYLW